MTFQTQALFASAGSGRFLRRVLAFDAATSGGLGLVLLAAAGVLAPWLELPRGHLTLAGAILLPFALAVGVIAWRPVPSPAVVWAIIVANGLWVLASLAMLVSGALTPNLLGYAFIAGQAVFVAVLAELEILGLKRLAGG